MKKQIIANTTLFIVIMIFVILFRSIFGSSNMMVGVSVLVIGLVTSQKDMTQNLKLLFFQLVCILLYMGLASYFAVLNPFIGLIFNIPFIFFITYWTTIGSKQTYHFPYVLGYLFLLLSSPITNVADLPGRLIALFAGAVLILALQYLTNKDTYRKMLKNENELVLNLVNARIERIISNDFSTHEEEKKSLEDAMHRFMKVTYERRNFNTPLTSDSMYRVSEIVAMEKLYYLLDDIEADYKSGVISEELLLEIKRFVSELKNDNYVIGTEIDKKWNQEHLPTSALKIKEVVAVLKQSENNEYPVRHESVFKLALDIDTHSLSFKFAMRLTVLLAVSLFITAFFKIEYGRWLCFTILALVQPGYEQSNKKTWMRFVGTAIGVTLFLILFSVFKGQVAHLLIIMIVSYTSMYVSRYDYSMIFTSIQSLGAAVISTSGDLSIDYFVAENRVGFIILGAILAFLGNRYLFTIRESQAKTYLIEKYEQCKNRLIANKEKYPHTVIVQSYHLIEMAGESRSKYLDWLNTSFDALVTHA